ncbi:MAG: hypothetical protein CM15mV18_1440 [uncultured marine virus]|nr:MAG: hypothetical protein CM15mV18_1440 [uncultured marine virus]
MKAGYLKKGDDLSIDDLNEFKIFHQVKKKNGSLFFRQPGMKRVVCSLYTDGLRKKRTL